MAESNNDQNTHVPLLHIKYPKIIYGKHNFVFTLLIIIKLNLMELSEIRYP